MKFSHSFEDEIFSVGNWEGFNATPQVLRDIVNNFKTFKSTLNAPIKLGHNDKQEVTDGQPALGWITAVRLDSETNPKKVFATYSDMPTIVFNAIKRKLYRTRSIELETLVKGGKLFKHVLTAVALLGSELPRVTNLRDLDKYLMSKDSGFTDDEYDNYKVASDRDTSITVKEQICFSININKKVSTMTPEEEAKLRADLAAANLKTTQLETDNVKLTGEKDAFSKTITDREATDKVEAVKVKRGEVVELFETAVKAEVITPAQRESFSKLLGVDDDVKVVSIELEDVKTLIGGDATLFSKKPTGKEDMDQQNEDDSAEDVLTTKAFEHMEKTGSEDFEKAMFSVMRTNPKLSVEYINSNGVIGD
jgi:hypothetical protein